MTTTQLDRSVRRAFIALCENVGSPLALKALDCVRREDWLGLVNVRVTIEDYNDPCTLSADLQIAAFFKKYPGFDLGIDLEQQAVETFWSAERQCYNSNEVLSPLLHDPLVYGEGIRDFISLVRKKVKFILGRCPRVSDLSPKFGPGSTFHDIGPYITVPDKMSGSYTLTPSARAFLHAWDTTAWSRYACANLEPFSNSSLIGDEEIAPGLGQNFLDSSFAPRTEEYVRGNRFTTVEKDALKRRGICIEPSINLFYQLGVGELISKRLGKLKWHKKDAQQYHRFLACIGSAAGSLATIDLSNASDTVAYNLVKLLLPRDWFLLLNSLRSSHTLVKGKWVKLEKFSSMGNGFTFELETLLFRAITDAVVDNTDGIDGNWYGSVVSSFGDDIICPTLAAPGVIAALRFFGFKINEEKSFISGGFRESCGGDFYRGHNVRPHYLKEVVNEPHQYIALANGLRRFGIRHILCGGPDLYRVPRLRILDSLPSQIRDLTGPEQLGDLVVWDDESTWRYKVRSSVRYFRVWRPVPFGKTGWHHFRPGVVLASALYGCGDGRPTRLIGSRELAVMASDGVLTRVNGSYISGYKFGRVPYS